MGMKMEIEAKTFGHHDSLGFQMSMESVVSV